MISRTRESFHVARVFLFLSLKAIFHTFWFLSCFCGSKCAVPCKSFRSIFLQLFPEPPIALFPLTPERAHTGAILTASIHVARQHTVCVHMARKHFLWATSSDAAACAWMQPGTCVLRIVCCASFLHTQACLCSEGCMHLRKQQQSPAPASTTVCFPQSES